MNPLALERAVAIDTVIRAARAAHSVFRELAVADKADKSDHSPVTVADYAAQAVVNSVLTYVFPDVPIVAEEDAKTLRAPEGSVMARRVEQLANEVLPLPKIPTEILDAIDLGGDKGGATGRFWTLDPIDGTKGFLRGGQYAVCLALIDRGAVRLGVMACPNLAFPTNDVKGCLFIAQEGCGAVQRGFAKDAVEEPIHVDANVFTEDALGATSFAKATMCESVDPGHSDQAAHARISRILGIVEPSLRMDSQCKYGILARGDAHVYLRLPSRVDYEENIWDHAAGSLIVREAGGTVTDVDGKALDFSVGRTLARNRGVVASATSDAAVHGRIIAAVQQAMNANINANI